MPVQRGRDSKGSWYRWGESGKKYYYKSNNKASREAAYQKTLKQARAIAASKNRKYQKG